jgi:hypothetical protein
MNNTYLIEVDRIEPNGDVVTITERRKLSATKSNKGLERQLNNLVNRIAEELKYYQSSPQALYCLRCSLCLIDDVSTSYRI